jgi:hypothetical protein
MLKDYLRCVFKGFLMVFDSVVQSGLRALSYGHDSSKLAKINH